MNTHTHTLFESWCCSVRGRKAALARALGVTRGTVTQWAAGHKKIPPGRLTVIEMLTKIKCKDLRPDLFGPAKAPRKQ